LKGNTQGKHTPETQQQNETTKRNNETTKQRNNETTKQHNNETQQTTNNKQKHVFQKTGGVYFGLIDAVGGDGPSLPKPRTRTYIPLHRYNGRYLLWQAGDLRIQPRT